MDALSQNTCNAAAWSADIDAIMAECDSLEKDLGAWFVGVATPLMSRRRGWSVRSLLRRPALCRALLLLWGTSPETRSRYTDEVRGGFLAAADSMGDTDVVAMLAGIVSLNPPSSRAAA